MNPTTCKTCGETIENGFETNSVNSDYCQTCKDIIKSCEHNCTSNCRREGCNCECGSEFCMRDITHTKVAQDLERILCPSKTY